jgi:phosphotransferase system HPr-like phosphotransfer protein
MMKVADLQQLVNSLTQPMRSAGASQKVQDDLARLGQGLEPFKESTMAEFNEFLQKAQQCVQTGEWPAPGKRASSRRSGSSTPGMSVHEAAQRLASLVERAAADANLDYAAIEAEVMSLAPMTGTQLKEAAEQVHITARGRTKDDLLKAIAVAIKERKTGPRAEHAGEAMAGGHAEPRHGHAGHGERHPVGAANPGHG